MGKVKIGIIGCGGIANGKHLPSLKQVQDAEMVAFCDLIPERAQKAAEEYGVPGARVYVDYKELLAKEDADVIHVCTPNISHCEITVAALRSGRHVMCEKPMATTVEDAEQMCNVSRETGKTLSIGYQTRCSLAHQYARKLVKEGVLGDVYYIKAPNIRRRGVPTWGVFMDREKQGGGPMIDIGTHSIDNAMYISGNYDVVSVTGSSYRKLADTCAYSNNARIWTKEEYQVEDSAMGFVKFANGCTMLVEASWALNYVGGKNLTFCGTNAGIEIEKDIIKLNGERFGSLYTEEIQPNSYARDIFPGSRMDASAYDAAQWIHAIQNNEKPLVRCEEALVVTKIIDAIYKSSENGKTIYFK